MSNKVTFRKNFIGKVGISDATNKQALQNILGEKPIDIVKLTHFTLKTTLPSSYRPLVWKILLGITPRFSESQDFVKQQHALIYEDLFRALKTLRLGGPISHQNDLNGHSPLGSRASLRLYRNGWNGHLSETKNPEPEHFLLMWLVSEARLLRNPEAQLNSQENQKYILISHKLHCLIDDPIDMFHICSSLWSFLRKNVSKIRETVVTSIALLRKENDNLHSHLNIIGLFSNSLLEEHCLSLFCEILPEASLEKLFDKIFAGSVDILSYVVVALLCQLQNSLYTCHSVESVRNVIYQIRKEQGDVILRVALDYWDKREASIEIAF